MCWHHSTVKNHSFLVKFPVKKYEKLKIVVWSMVLWSDAHGRCMWWIVIQIGEQFYSVHSELLGADIDK
jgi:hypothetical protein